MAGFNEELDRAMLAFERGTKPAREIADALLAAYPDEPQARALAVAARIGAGDLAAARAVELGDDGPSLAARARLLSKEKDLAGAVELSERAVLLAPDDPVVLGLAGAVIRTVDPEHALALARRAVELRPHDPGPYSRLVGPLAALEEWDEIAALLNDPPPAFAASPGHVHLRAVELRRRGDLAGAQAAARELVALTPDDATAWGLLAFYLSNEDLRSEADAAALHALDLNPRQDNALLVLSRSAEARG